MKKIFFKLLSFVLTLGSFFMLSTTDVKAEKVTLSIGYEDGVFYTRKGDGMNDSHKFTKYSLNGTIAFCIQPGKQISDWDYITNDISKSPFNKTITDKLTLIGHYGYDYPGHNTLKYRMATQALIWETARNIKVDFYTKQYGQGNHIDISAERNEIMRLVNNHTTRPSFHGNTIDATLKQEITIVDNNNVLSEFEVIDDGGNTVSIVDNKIVIVPNSFKESQITIQKKKYDDKTTILYIGEDGKSQMLGRFRYNDPINAYIKLNTTGGTVAINKIDSETTTAQGDATLKGATYGIYDSDDALLTTITTDNNGFAKSPLLNRLGTFYIKEISSSNGYLVDNTKYEFEIAEDDLNPVIKVEENVIKGNLSILKLYGMDSLIPENNITFDIYLKSSNKLVQSITTNFDGTTKATLPYGTYIVKQKNTTPNYEKVSDFEITINENGQNISKNLINKPLSAKLKIVKIDEDTKEVVKLAGIKFKIKDLSTNEYVCQKITYPTATTVCEFETDNSGVFITPNNLLGDFEIEEVKSQKIDGYLWNSEKIKVHIGDNAKFENDAEYGKLVTASFSNKKVKGKIEIYKFGEKLRTKNDNQMLRSKAPINDTFGNDIISFNEIPLANVKFGLYKDDDTLVREAITDSNGYVLFDNLELGKYYVKEISVNDLYILDETKHEFDLKYIDQFTPIVMDGKDIRNHLKKGTIEFTKTDFVNGNPIPNTKLKFYTSNDELFYTAISDKNGKVTIDNLPIGKYYIKEYESATGYLLSDEIVYFEIKENGEIVKANMTNKKITGNLEISKTDISTDEPLPNVLFEIYTKDNKLVLSKRTDENGKIVIKNLEYGDYYFVEKESLENYVLNDEKMYFSIKEDGKTIKSNVKNKKITGTLELTKTDVSMSETLPNTLFEIYNANTEELLFSERTDENGQIIIPNLEYNDYYILEKEAPEGYVLNDEKMYFSIKEDGQIVKATFTDEKIIVEVPKTSLNDSIVVDIICGVMIVLGIGYLIYESKKNK